MKKHKYHRAPVPGIPGAGHSAGFGPDHYRNLAAVMIGAHVLGVFWLGPFLGATGWAVILIVLILWFTIARAWPRKFR